MRPVKSEEILETRRAVLEPIHIRHAESVYEYLLDQRLYRFIPRDPPESLKTLEERYRVLSSRVSPDSREVWLDWAMKLRGSGGYVGMMEATVREESAETVAYVAYTVFVLFQRRGFAAEGCGRIIRHLLEDYGVEVVAAEIDTRNTASVASLGFERVAKVPNADFFKGASSDEYRYELRRAARG
jgi:RimJ/RimL family protein N-acetyltransferase